MSINNEKRRQAMANHKANLAASLSHRIEVARADNNDLLINQLEKEKRQLGLSV